MVYRIQVIAGVDPGIEFAEPIRRYSPANIVCGDAPAKDTVKHIYNVFGAPLKSLADSQKSVSDLVKRVILPPKGGVSIFSLFLKEPARLKELARLILPASALAIGIGLVGNAGAVALESTSVVTGLSHGPSGPLFPLIMAVIQTLVVSYSIASTLKFLKVLISDRDTILAKSILDTAARLQQEQGKPGTVCAVVGLLHVNGILKLLQEHNEKENVLS